MNYRDRYYVMSSLTLAAMFAWLLGLAVSYLIWSVGITRGQLRLLIAITFIVFIIVIILTAAGAIYGEHAVKKARMEAIRKS